MTAASRAKKTRNPQETGKTGRYCPAIQRGCPETG